MATQKYVTKTVTKLNDATDWISPRHDAPIPGLDMSIQEESAFVGTIALQKRRGASGAIKTVETYTEDEEARIDDPVAGVQYRLICTAYTSGQCVLELYR